MAPMSGAAPTVFIVDDAREIRKALSRLLEAANYQVRAFASAECFLEERDCEGPGCLLLDLRLPGMSGLDLQRSLFRIGAGPPDHLSHRSRGYPNQRASHENGCCRLFDETNR